MKLWRRLWPYIKPQLPTLIVAYGFIIVLAAATSLYAFLAGPALKFIFSGSVANIIRGPGGEVRGLWSRLPPSWLSTLEHLDLSYAAFVLPTLIVITAFIKGLAQTGQFYLLGKISQRVLLRLRDDVFSALLRQPPAFFTRRSHGDLQSRLTSDTHLLEQAVFYGCAPLLREPLAILFLIGFCFLTNPRLAFLTFVIVPIAVFPLARFSRWLKKVSRRGQNAQGDINAVSYESLAGIRVVQAFGNESLESERLHQAGLRYYRQMLVSYFIRAARTPTMEFLGSIALAVLLAVLSYQVNSRGADPTQYLSFFVAIVMMYDPLKKLGGVGDYLAAGSAGADRIFELIDLPPEIRNAPNAKPLALFNHAIEFKNVGFAYESERFVLDNLNLWIPKGSIVALVGRSGAGKSTVANLLPRFYDVNRGGIYVDGQDVRELTVESLRRQISVVSQDTFLFNASVESNILYGDPSAGHTAVLAAAKAAFAEEFIRELPQGYKTVIGERGVTLSGGQRQRLSIARALLRNAPILILDEATSSLDLESERYVQEALDVLMQGRTSLVIAHRLSTVRRATNIIVLKDGMVCEQGAHEALLEKNGEYARLYALQFRDDDTPTPPKQLIN